MMGNHRFRISDMMPNAWFYKLKDTNKSQRNHSTKKTNNTSPKSSPTQKAAAAAPLIPNRASYYFPSDSPIHPKANDTHFPLDSPRKSTRKPQNRKPVSTMSSSCRGSVSESESDTSCICKNIAPSSTDIVLDIGSELELRPILTRPTKIEVEEDDDNKKLHPKNSSSRRASLRSPRMSTKKVRIAHHGGNRRRGLAESFAVVKSSSNPMKDFRESMMEMILENNLNAAKDLEELLACYLSLNSNEYHEVIVRVFEEIWFDITDIVRK